MKRALEKISIELTPEQVREAYLKLVRSENEDWLYEPAVVEEIHRRATQAQNELKSGRTTRWQPQMKK